MIIWDTDILTLYLRQHPRIVQRHQEAQDEVVISVITWIETMRGRFDTLLKATDGVALLRGQQRLDQAEKDLAFFRVLPITDRVAAEFDRLREHKKLKTIGRGDLLIASIALAYRVLLVTRNEKDFRQVPGLRIENWAD